MSPLTLVDDRPPVIERNTENGIAINHIMRQQQLTASKQQLLETAAAHTFIPNTSPKHKTATSKLKHGLLYYLNIELYHKYYQVNSPSSALGPSVLHFLPFRPQCSALRAPCRNICTYLLTTQTVADRRF